MSMGPKIFAILMVVALLGVGIYIVKSGVFGKLGSTRAINFFDSLKSSSSFRVNVPEYGYRGGGSGTKQPVKQVFQEPPPRPAQQTVPLPAKQTINPAEIPAGFTERELSPYFKKVRIGSVSPGSPSYYGQVSLYANYANATSSINVTGWLLKANKGSQYIPRAVGFYDVLGLAAENYIYLGNSDYLNIYTSASAIGKNLRLNKCIGYLENTNHFTPSLPTSCPSIDRSDVSSFSGACQDYILSLGSCRLPKSNPNLPQTDYACRSFLETINYKGCLDRHSSDADFLSREWRAWSGSTFLDERHDRILLFDGSGLLVDAYNY